MHDHHHPHHAHAGHHHSQGVHRKLLWAVALTLGFAGVETLAGWWSGSLALLGDAGHMLTDASALGLAAFAALLALRSPSSRHSYGLGRAEILAALFNALLMIALVALISAEAIRRFNNPTPVMGGAVMGVAFIGLLVNLAAAWLLSHDHHNLNVRAALLHVLGDLMGSVAALISGAIISLTGWMTIDPLLSLLIVLLILVSALRVLREALHTLMEGVPTHLNLQDIGMAMAKCEGVVSIHDLHIWTLSANTNALSAHIVVHDPLEWPGVLYRVRDMLTKRFGISHVTLQPEIDVVIVHVDNLKPQAPPPVAE
ncbi:MAG: cation diffusion facilitator family transporter [Candidatus Thiodiazotropha sp.]